MSIAIAVESGRGGRVSEGDADLQALLPGDKAAWDRFVTRHAAVIFAAVRPRRLVPAGRTADAEAVVQGVFVWLCQTDFRQIGRASGRERVGSYVYISGVAGSRTQK